MTNTISIYKNSTGLANWESREGQSLDETLEEYIGWCVEDGSCPNIEKITIEDENNEQVLEFSSQRTAEIASNAEEVWHRAMKESKDLGKYFREVSNELMLQSL